MENQNIQHDTITPILQEIYKRLRLAFPQAYHTLKISEPHAKSNYCNIVFKKTSYRHDTTFNAHIGIRVIDDIINICHTHTYSDSIKHTTVSLYDKQFMDEIISVIREVDSIDPFPTISLT